MSDYFKWDWEFEEQDENDIKIPYIKNNVIYGLNLSKITLDILKKFKFKLEDKILCSNYKKIDNFLVKNKTGHVVDMYDDPNNGLYLIYFDVNVNGHDQNEIPFGHAWWCPGYSLIKI